jgi:Acyl-CoA carboxylase epsilon subunit
MSSADEVRRPVLRVIRGDATDEEIAALLTVIAARGGSARTGAQTGGDAPASAWSDHDAGLRRPHQPGPGAWRASAWQR